MTLQEQAQDVPTVESTDHFIPEPVTIAETGLDTGLLGDIVLKALYYAGQAAPGQLGAMLALSQPVIQEVMHFLSRGKLCEVMGSEGRGPTSYRSRLSDTGVERTAAAFERNTYVGPAPVPLADYVNQVRRQSVSQVRFDPRRVEEALAELVLSPETRKRIGKAIASRRPTLIYGASGNGKSTVACRLGEALSGRGLVPHALEGYGHIVRLFDPSKHPPAEEGQKST